MVSEGKSNRSMKKTPHQLSVLEKAYASNPKPNSATTTKLSKDLGLTCVQVQGWFKRQRVKTRNGLRALPVSQLYVSESDSESESNLKQPTEPLEAANILGQIASNVDPLQIKMEERTAATNGKQDKRETGVKRLRFESSAEAASDSDSGPSNEPLVEIDKDGENDSDVKNKMIDMLNKKNKRDEANCQSIMDEYMRLEKSIEDRKKLIDDIKKVC
ncbi:uncharacterized protein [Rutidosis leptorrhynchoides]|uniref:uncharacterized protein n=1 Tax=Rutidosis leptorrhynchoides TaxID=125765 RepID=UPI003A996280